MQLKSLENPLVGSEFNNMEEAAPARKSLMDFTDEALLKRLKSWGINLYEAIEGYFMYAHGEREGATVLEEFTEGAI